MKISDLIGWTERKTTEERELGEVLDYEQPNKYIVESTNYNNKFHTPVLTAGQSFVLGYSNETNDIYSADKVSPVIIFDDFTTSNHWVDFPFKVKSSAMKILTPRQDIAINFRFVYYAMKCIKFSPSNHARHWISVYSKFRIPLPSLEIQSEIVRILDTFKDLEAELEAELAARKKQYEYYRDELLRFKNKSDVNYLRLGDVCDCVDYRGKTPKKTPNGILLITAKNIKKGYIDYTASKEYIAPENFENVMRRGKVKVGDILFTTEAPCGNVALADREDFALAQRVIKYRVRSDILNNNFLKHILLSKEFGDKLSNASTGSTVKGVRGSVLHKLTIPVPPLAEQTRIASILDKFDKLTNSLTEGIPAEIKMRQQQYEYYRNKLLTFRK